MRKLSVEIGPRVAGSPAEIAARDYVAAQLESFGYDVSLQDFEFDISSFVPSRVDAGGSAIPAYALEGSASGVVSGALFDAGLGFPEDYPPEGIAGRVAVVERGEITFSQKIENAQAVGAAALIIYNNEDRRLLASANMDTAVPYVGLSRDDGQALLDRLDAGPLDVTVTVPQPRGTAYNIVARPPGGQPCDTVSGGHVDSVPVTGGADDNASGSAAVIELARVAAVRGAPGVNCFVLFGAEEIGLVGSQHYVETMTDDEVNILRAMLNLDVVGLDDEISLIGSDDMIEIARIEADRLGIEASRGRVPNGAGSDHASFQRAGVPVVFFYRNDDLIHTPRDSIERISPDALAEVVELAYATIVSLNGD